MLQIYGLLVLFFVSLTGYCQPYIYFCNTVKHKEFTASVFFESGEFKLTQQSSKTLDSLKRLLENEKAGAYDLELVGFADSVGDDSANRILSQNRVNEVAKYYETYPVIRKICLCFHNHCKVCDHTWTKIDTIRYSNRNFRGENFQTNDSSVKNRRVDIVFALNTERARGYCVPIHVYIPETDTTIAKNNIKIYIPQGTLYSTTFYSPSLEIDTSISQNFSVYIDNLYFNNNTSTLNSNNYNVCRFLKLIFDPDEARQCQNIDAEWGYIIRRKNIQVKIPLTHCEVVNKVRLYSYTDSVVRFKLLEKQEILTQNDTTYLVATIPILETDSLVLAYPYTEPKKDIYRQLVFRGKTKIEPYIVNGCELTAINAEPSTTFFFFNRSKTSISSTQRVVYLKSSEADKYWPVKLSQFKKRGTRYILTKKELKRIKQGKLIVIKK
jgi:DNA-binding XRE family transcriptional regulator